MLVIRIEIWPWGRQENAKLLGVARISNDGTGTPDKGNYTIELEKTREETKKDGVWKKGTLTGFPRLKLPVWNLVYEALKKTLGEKN